jgi:hypothetical protein
MEIGNWKLHWRIEYCVIACLLLAAPASDALAQASDRPRVSLGASVGTAGLQGTYMVPAGERARAVTARVTLRINRFLSADVESTFTARVKGPTYARRWDWHQRQDVRDIVTSAYARGHVWSHAGISLDMLAGFAWVSTGVNEFSRGYNPPTQQWSEWRPVDPSLRLSSDYDHVMFVVGADLPLGSDRFAIVPEVRARVPFAATTNNRSAPYLSDVTRFAIGARVGF